MAVPRDHLVEHDSDSRVRLTLHHDRGLRRRARSACVPCGMDLPSSVLAGYVGAGVHRLLEHRVHGRVAGECRAVVSGPRRQRKGSRYPAPWRRTRNTAEMYRVVMAHDPRCNW
jgi:hypothetical protein